MPLYQINIRTLNHQINEHQTLINDKYLHEIN